MPFTGFLKTLQIKKFELDNLHAPPCTITKSLVKLVEIIIRLVKNAKSKSDCNQLCVFGRKRITTLHRSYLRKKLQAITQARVATCN